MLEAQLNTQLIDPTELEDACLEAIRKEPLLPYPIKLPDEDYDGFLDL